jgi:hypothetical protein
MKKFLVLYLVPASVLEDWSKTDPEKRKMAEEKMRGDWNKWMSNHAKMITDTGLAARLNVFHQAELLTPRTILC